MVVSMNRGPYYTPRNTVTLMSLKPSYAACQNVLASRLAARWREGGLWDIISILENPIENRKEIHTDSSPSRLVKQTLINLSRPPRSPRQTKDQSNPNKSGIPLEHYSQMCVGGLRCAAKWANCLMMCDV